MTIRTHPDQCMSAGTCIRMAPKYFGADDDGWVRLLQQTASEEDIAAVRSAAAACPTASIDIDESPRTDKQQPRRE
ncbi:ferredoxin [Mycobacteriaceae bacterium NPDC060252]